MIIFCVSLPLQFLSNQIFLQLLSVFNTVLLPNLPMFPHSHDPEAIHHLSHSDSGNRFSAIAAAEFCTFFCSIFFCLSFFFWRPFRGMKRSFFRFLFREELRGPLPAITEWIRILWTSFILSPPGPLVLQQQAMPRLFYCQFLRTWRWRSLGTQNRRATRKANPDDIIDKICHQFVGGALCFWPRRVVILVTEGCLGWDTVMNVAKADFAIICSWMNF